MEDSKTTSLNIGKIYRHIYRNRGSSRQALAADLRFSLPTVTQYLNRLTEEGLICNAGEFQSTGGRKAYMFRIIPDARYAIGIDITQSYIAAVLVNLNLDLITVKKKKQTFQDLDSYYAVIQTMIEELIRETAIDPQKVLGVGISLPAIIEEEQEILPNRDALDLPENFYQKISAHIPYPTRLFNDANSAGLAELWTRDTAKPMAYLSLSNTVGGAIILNREVYNGNHFRGAEFGHMTVVPHGKRCYCGKKGCLNSYCSALVLSDYTNGDLGEFFHELYEKQNPGFLRTFEEYCSHLAIAVNNLRMCFDCDIVLGGNVGMYMEHSLDSFRRTAAKLSPYDVTADYIQTCMCKTEPSAVGAAVYYIDQFIHAAK